MVIKSDIQEKLSAIAKGRMSPWDFHVWIEDASWNMHQDSSEDVIALVGEIKVIFEDYYHGLLSELELIEKLAATPVVEILSSSRGYSHIEINPYGLVFRPAGSSIPQFAV